ncbi:hypothetical protein ACA910_011230 [Epithemia clementina (nom. ined.)]
MAQGICEITNTKGEPQSLEHLHYGVNYHEFSDSIECIKPNACREYTIQGCYEVNCKREGACQDAKLIDNAIVTCSAENACDRLKVINGHEVVCGGQLWMNNFCQQAQLESDDIVHCVGPRSCVSASQYQRMVFRVGAKGHVSCRNLNNQNEFSCRNMVIEVSSLSRACFNRAGQPKQDCAIACNMPHDCDENTIDFRIVVK